MKKLSAVLSIGLILSILSVCYGDSKKLDADLMRSEGYASAMNIKKDFESGKMRARTDKAIENLVKVSIAELRKKNANLLANQIEREYEMTYKNFLSVRGVGDHAGVQWLLKIHDNIEFVLGEQLCRAVRMHDLWTLAMTIPVVFSCEDNVDFNEYAKHFSPFCGVVSFWISYGVCTGISLGTGFMYACGVIGDGCEQVAKVIVAPLLVKTAWKGVCPKALR